MGRRSPASRGSQRPSHLIAQRLASDLEAVLRPFLAQSVRVASVVTLGWHPSSTAARDDPKRGPVVIRDDAMLCRVTADGDGGPAIAASVPIPPAGDGAGGGRTHTLGSLARHARELSNGARGDHLLLLPGRILEDMIGPLTDRFAFRGVVILSRDRFDRRRAGQGRDGPLPDGDVWRLQRRLFDRGLVGIGSVRVRGGQAHCFLASGAVRSMRRLAAGSRRITISCLGSTGRFANQLFQYAYGRLYALRHGATAAFPVWEGQQLFGLEDPPCDGVALPRLTFNGFSDEDRRLWEADDPPIDVDLWG